MSQLYVHDKLSREPVYYFPCNGCGELNAVFRPVANVQPAKKGVFRRKGFKLEERFIGICIACGSSVLFMFRHGRWYRVTSTGQLVAPKNLKIAEVDVKA